MAAILQNAVTYGLMRFYGSGSCTSLKFSEQFILFFLVCFLPKTYKNGVAHEVVFAYNIIFQIGEKLKERFIKVVRCISLTKKP